MCSGNGQRRHVIGITHGIKQIYRQDSVLFHHFVANGHRRLFHVGINRHGREPVSVAQSHLALEFEGVGIIEQYPVVVEVLVRQRSSLDGLHHHVARVRVEADSRCIKALELVGAVPVDFNAFGQGDQLVGEGARREIIAADVVLILVIVIIDLLGHGVNADHAGTPSAP